MTTEFTVFEMWHIHLKTLKLSGTESIHSSCYSEITDRGQKMTIFGKLAISPDEGPYRKNWSSQTLHQRPDYYRGNFRWNPSRHVLEKASAKCHLKRHLSPHLGLTIAGLELRILAWALVFHFRGRSLSLFLSLSLWAYCLSFNRSSTTEKTHILGLLSF